MQIHVNRLMSRSGRIVCFQAKGSVLYLGTALGTCCSLMYLNSNSQKYPIFCFASFVLQILVKFQKLGQFRNLHILRIPKLSLEVKFDLDLAEKIKVEDNKLISK